MAKTVAYVFGAVLLIVGIIGFFMNPVVGLFPVNTLHNLVHIVSGLFLIGGAMWWSSTKTLITLGVVYVLVFLLQLVVPDLTASLLNTSMADLWLHVALAVVFLGAGFMGRSERPMAAAM